MLTYVEKYDPTLVKREMSNKKIYLYDNGFASAIQYAFSEDRGKHLENLVFAAIRSTTEEIFFLKNGFECDFVVLPDTRNALLIQVTDVLHQDNFKREINGLEKARKRIKNSSGLLLTRESTIPHKALPDWVEIKTVSEWLLKR